MPDLTTFFAYCFDKDDRYYPPVTLTSVEAVRAYVNLHREHFREIRITDTDDYIIVQVINGEVIWPIPDREAL